MGADRDVTLFAPARITAETAADGSVLLRSAEPLGAYPATVVHSVREWALADPGHLLVAERAPDGTSRQSPGAALRRQLIMDEALRRMVARALADHNASAGSAARIERLLVMAHRADLDAGEITDKGYVNQRQVLARRSRLVELLYADPPADGVVVAGDVR